MNRPSEAVVDARIALVRAQQASLLKIERALRAAGLPPAAWYDALCELERAGADGLRPFELESQRLIAQSNVSRLIDRLEHDGLVERRACADDGRGQIVVLTAAGRDMRKRMWPIYAKAIADAIGRHLTDREAVQIGLSPSLHPAMGRVSVTYNAKLRLVCCGHAIAESRRAGWVRSAYSDRTSDTPAFAIRSFWPCVKPPARMST